MIVVKIELWPFGDESQKTEIGRTLIANDGTGSVSRGNYDVRVLRRNAYTLSGTEFDSSATRTGRVEGYPRLSYNIWRLILRALRSAFPEER